jgi:hypothetical protein
MSDTSGLVFLRNIEPTWENAVIIQELTFQDVIAGKFPNPESIADPANEKMVSLQQQKLRDFPERYSGYAYDGKLVAYIKHHDWLVSQELDFATGAYTVALKAIRALRMNPSTGQWGISGLVASDELPEAKRNSILADLLQLSFVDPHTGRGRSVNVVVHEHDPLLNIILGFGFVEVGEPKEVKGAPGLKQKRYQSKVRN